MNLHKFLRIVLSWILFGSSVSREIGDRCSTPLGISGFCTFLSKCDHLLQLLMAPRPIPVENKRYLAQSQCGWRADQPLVCCGNLQRKLVSIDVRTSGFPETPEECAIKSASRVVGGTDTAIGELPWAALIKYRNATGASAFHCSSTLISHQFAVTAAHCIFGSGIYRVWTATEVRLGEWDLASSVDCVGDSDDFECADPHLDIAIRNVIPHDNYVPSSRSQYHDIALIRLAQSVPFTDFIRPICLPRKPHLRQQGATGQRFMVAGWGRTELTSTSLRLRKVYLRGADAGQCRDLYRKEGVFLLGGQLCAEGAHGAARDSCKGDSGAGLVAIDDSDLRNTHWYLAGIVSFGFSPCGLRNRPGVYTRVADYVDWIEAQLLATQ